MKKATKFKRVGQNLYLHRTVYYAVLKKSGKQIWRSLRTSDRNIARANLETLRQQLFGVSKMVSKKHTPTFEQACDELIRGARADKIGKWSLTSLEGRLDLAKKSFLGPLKIPSIQEGHLEQFLRGVRARCSGRTANIDLIHLRKVFRLAVRRGWRIDDPTARLTPHEHREKKVPVPSQKEIQDVLHVLRTRPYRYGKRTADMIEFMSLSGLRIAEAQSFEWKNIDWERNYLVVRGKGDKVRVVDLFPNLKAFLLQLRSRTDNLSGKLFPPKPGGSRAFNPKNTLADACEKAEVQKFSYHGLRHAWATHLVELKIDPATIAAWMGHVDASLVVKRYGVHSRRQHFEKVAQTVIFDRPVVQASM